MSKETLFKFRKALLLSILITTALARNATSFAQTSIDGEAYEQAPDGAVKNALQYTQGVKIYEDWFSAFFDGWNDMVWEEWYIFIDISIALAGLCTQIFFVGRSYGMLTGDRNWEILPLLRPFGLLLIILNWKLFCSMIAYPISLMAQYINLKNEGQQELLTDLRIIRYEYQKALVDNIYVLASEADQAQRETEKIDENTFTSTMRDFWNEVGAPIKQFQYRMQFIMQLLMTTFIETIAFWILRIALYAVLAFQVVFSGILLIFGPLTVALSILPSFRDSFQVWIARFISINFYHVIAGMNMYIGGIFVEYAMKSEILKYKELISRDGTPAVDIGEKLLWLASNGVLSFGTVIIAFLVTAALMFTVPSISNWIVNSSGVSEGVSQAKRGISSTFNASRLFK